MKKIGIIGGTFNPVHLGHTAIAEAFCAQMELDACYFVPSNISPFRIGEKPEVSNSDRVNMINLAISYHPLFRISLFELENGGISYTVKTVEKFAEDFPDAGLCLLIGADQANHFHRWHKYRDILAKVTLCIALRPDYDLVTDPSISGYTVISAPLLDISSTNIRFRLKERKEMRGLIHPAVYDYIYDNNLFI